MRLRLDLGAPPHRASASALQPPPPIVVPGDVCRDFEWLALEVLLDDLADRG
jgi:hypothetical protein